MKWQPFKIVRKGGKHLSLKRKVEERTFISERISAIIRSKTREVTEAYLDDKVSHALSYAFRFKSQPTPDP